MNALSGCMAVVLDEKLFKANKSQSMPWQSRANKTVTYLTSRSSSSSSQLYLPPPTHVSNYKGRGRHRSDHSISSVK
jgi:hypothetical protein